MNALAAMWMALGLLPVPLTEEEAEQARLQREEEIERSRIAKATERLERRQRQLAQRRERKGLR